MKHIAVFLGLVALVASVTPTFAQSETWTVDPAHSAAQFSVRHMMVSTVRGEMGPMKGTVKWDGKDVRTIEVDVVIDVTQINTRTEARDKDLRSPNFFDVEKYPEITFRSTRVQPVADGQFKLVGDLTMHGVTREVTLDVEGPTPPVKMGNALRIGAAATTRLNRFDYGLTWNRTIEAGGVIVGPEVGVTIDLELTKRVETTGGR